LRFEP